MFETAHVTVQLSFADFCDLVRMSKFHRHGFRQEIETLGEKFNHRSEERWRQLWSAYLARDRSRRT